jgi:uncharacterized protein YgiB involved in biofilm formation
MHIVFGHGPVMRLSKAALAASFLTLAATFGGCGDSGPANGSKAGDARGVIVSSTDCVSFGPKAVDACTKALEKAVNVHEASTASYGNIQACETAIGPNNCERSASGKYRPRLLAFMVTVSGAAARAEPLYAAKDGAVGFQTADKDVLLAIDQSLAFSRLALSVAEMQAGSGKKAVKVPKF